MSILIDIKLSLQMPSTPRALNLYKTSADTTDMAIENVMFETDQVVNFAVCCTTDMKIQVCKLLPHESKCNADLV